MCTVLAAFALAGRGTADDAPHPATESRVLERYIGNWDEVMTNKPTEWMPMTQKSTVNTRRAWALGGKFVRGEGKWQPGNAEFLHLVTFDPEAKVYRSWYFDAAGGIPRGSVTGTWDEKATTMRWRGTDEAGNKSVGTHHFIDKDRQEWTLVVTNPNGKVVLDLTGKCTRRKD